jgi:hypothetical protein
MQNNNGNATLFFLSLFTALAPGYPIRQGKHMATTIYFGYLLALYGVAYFTSMWNVKYNPRYARNGKFY